MNARRRFGLAMLALVTSSALLAPLSPNSAFADGRGFDPANLDTTCKPCDDFYAYANGGWMKSNPVPGEQPSWGMFDKLYDRNQTRLKQILEEAAANASSPAGSLERKLGDFYASGMDMARIDANGLTPLGADLARIDGIRTVKDLQAVVAHLHRYGIDAMFSFGSTQDAKNATSVIGEATQGGIGLPERDYYFKDDERTKTIRAEYLKHVARVFELSGDDGPRAAARAGAVMAIETSLAEKSMTAIEMRDPNALYHKMDARALKALTPSFGWPEYFRGIGARRIGDINVAQPEFFRNLDRQIGAVSLDDWKSYLRWRLLDALAPYLPTAFVEENFNFNGRTLQGTPELRPLWKRRVSATDNFLGDALAQVYVKKAFTPEAKARALEMVRNLKLALRERLGTLEWMSDATRQQAYAKLDAFVDKIGYPDKWKDYSRLRIDRGPFVLNVLRATEFATMRDLEKVGRPVDRNEWGMTAPTVNAYYNPLLNEIAFPAGILQPPFFDPLADDAVNYGGIGAVIGHEMTHGFDDEGSQFDARGNLRNWWTEADKKNFTERAKCVQDQFSGYTIEGSKVKGDLVLGESIADLGGVTIAYAAFQKSLEGKPRPADIDGLSPEQRFFLGWAQVWAENARSEYLKLLVDTDPHPPSRYRVNGPLSNMPAFAKAFGCKAGSPMVRADASRCAIW